MRPFITVCRFLGFGLATFISGCAGLGPIHVDDPRDFVGLGPTPSKVVKSIRCEMITFFVNNRLRILLKDSHPLHIVGSADVKRIYNNFPDFQLDPAQYAVFQAEFKNIDALTLQIGYDWKRATLDKYKTADSKDWHLGPSDTITNTYDLIQQYVLAQDSDLGSAISFGKTHQPPAAAKYTNLYNSVPTEDVDFSCYRDFFESRASGNYPGGSFVHGTGPAACR